MCKRIEMQAFFLELGQLRRSKNVITFVALPDIIFTALLYLRIRWESMRKNNENLSNVKSEEGFNELMHSSFVLNNIPLFNNVGVLFYMFSAHCSFILVSHI